MSLNNPTPTTELDAVNIMLSVIGESPVNSLDDNLVVDAVIAKDILREVAKEVQSEGWHFNSESNYPLPLSVGGEVSVPPNTVSVKASLMNSVQDITVRGGRLYDRERHTFLFTQTQYVEIVLMLPFDDLPETARRYILVRAGRIFQDRIVGSDTLHGFNQQDEARARATLLATETENADLHVLDGLANGAYVRINR